MSEYIDAKTDFSADSSMLGYFHQCRLALLEGLKRLYDNPSLEIAIETLDDVVFHANGTPTELIQVKHHISRRGDLTNASVDLWKTLRIWAELYLKRKISPHAELWLMTTATAPENSIVSKLKMQDRDESTALSLLQEIATTSSNKENQTAYIAFLKLNTAAQKQLLSKIFIADNCPTSKTISYDIEKQLCNACARKDIPVFTKYLEAWWFSTVVDRLSSSSLMTIQGREIEEALSRLRDQFKFDSLPIHSDIDVAKPDTKKYLSWIFAKQLRLIAIGENRIHRAALYFYKASEQRSRWIREQLLLNEELVQYDKRLTEEWEDRFEQAIDGISDNEDDHVKVGKKLYSWFETESNIPIRAACIEKFITRGSYHLLANQLRIGWHPRYKQKLPLLTDREE